MGERETQRLTITAQRWVLQFTFLGQRIKEKKVIKTEWDDVGNYNNNGGGGVGNIDNTIMMMMMKTTVKKEREATQAEIGERQEKGKKYETE